jgi:hypothetical protein
MCGLNLGVTGPSFWPGDPPTTRQGQSPRGWLRLVPFHERLPVVPVYSRVLLKGPSSAMTTGASCHCASMCMARLRFSSKEEPS